MPAGPSSSADGGDSESDATATVSASRGLQHQRSGILRQRPSGTPSSLPATSNLILYDLLSCC